VDMDIYMDMDMGMARDMGTDIKNFTKKFWYFISYCSNIELVQYRKRPNFNTVSSPKSECVVFNRTYFFPKSD
jgi:hypothetical protein